MASASGSIQLIGYHAEQGDGVVFAVLEPVLAGSVIEFSASNMPAAGGAAAASWAWTATSDLAAGSRLTIRSSQESQEPGVEISPVLSADIAAASTFEGIVGGDATIETTDINTGTAATSNTATAPQARMMTSSVMSMMAADSPESGVVSTENASSANENAASATGVNDAAPVYGDGDDALNNADILFGGVFMRGGQDTLINSGTIIAGDGAAVDMGDGNDTVVLEEGSSIYGEILLGQGNDTLSADGVESDLTVDAGGGNDVVTAGAGDDFIKGDDGDDDLNGGRGDDVLQGGAGADRLVGGSGDDILFGDAGDDFLIGGSGNNVLSGGAGNDVMEVEAGSSASIDGGDGEDTTRLVGTGAGMLSGTENVETLVVEGGDWALQDGAAFNAVDIRNGASVTTGLVIDNNDRVTVAAGGKLTAENNTLTWKGGGNAVLSNGGLIEASAGNRLLEVAAKATGSLVIDNLAGATLSGALSPSAAGAAGARITLNNAGVIEADGRVVDFRKFDGAGAVGTINNLAGGEIRQVGDNTDVLRPGINGTVNNWGTISAEAGAVGGGDLIDFQNDTGGTVNNYAGGLLEGARHAITGDHAVAIMNEGTVVGRNGSAVNIDNDGSEADRVFITNRGTLEGRSAGLTSGDGSDGDAIDVDGLVTISNSGAIKGLGASGAKDGEPNVSEGIAIGGGTIINNASGQIYGYGRAIQVDNSGNANALGATLVVNDGLIQGDGNGPEGVSEADAARFDLRGNEAINLIGDYADEIINTSGGRILGGVAMGGGNDRLNNSGSITATGGSAVDMGAGDDVVSLYVGARIDGTILLGDGNDLAVASSPNGFIIDGGAGDDQVYLNNGDDRVFGGIGSDIVYTSGGNDWLDGGEGDDTLNGEAGDDTIFGGAGNDTIAGGTGNDTIDAGAGDDLIAASGGDDVVDGGEGTDTLDLSAATGTVYADMGLGRASGTGIGVQRFSGIENLVFGSGNNIVAGGNGDDSFDGGAGNDTMNGGAGDDNLAGGLGNDALNGGSGDDILSGNEGEDTLTGGSGDDQLLGNTGNDRLTGGSGNDLIEGGAGNDILTGGSDFDTFHFAAGFGQDRIEDFGVSDPDRISFEGLFDGFNAVLAATTQVGNDVVITVDDQNTLLIAGTTLANLGADDFRFA